MATKTHEGFSVIDEFLPNHDFSARYEIRINAPTSKGPGENRLVQG